MVLREKHMKLIATIKRLATAVAALSVIAVAQGVTAQTFIKAQTASPGAGAYLATVGFDKVVAAHTDFKMQINASQTVTKSMIVLGRGEIDISSLVIAQTTNMREQKAMYSKLADAPELAANLRSIFSFSAGAFHFITYAGSGIETLEDIKGKKVYLGPPSGAASKVSRELIEIATGYTPDEDYEGVLLGWGAGAQAMTDRQVDVFVRPAPLGGAIVQQFGLSNEFRLLGLSDEALALPEMQAKFVNGNTQGLIPAGTYKGQVNGDVDVSTLSFWLVMGSSPATSDETIYTMTKALWENLDEFHETAPLLKETTRDTAFTMMNAPLHLGAYRYYKEAGFDIPEDLVPPEAG